jgi:hypothetical protein
MIATAIKLTEAGMGDYYEDVDQAVRNQLVESQLLRADFLEQIAAQSPPHTAARHQSSERVIERNLGILTPMPIWGYEKPYGLGCCTANGAQGLYYAWSKIIERDGPAVKINLLLNRASPWMDIDSFLPYEGKVVLRNKTAQIAYVRLPSWVDRRQVKISQGAKAVACRWVNSYLIIPDLKPAENVKVDFPMVEDTAVYTFQKQQYTCRFRGNTLVDFSPRPTGRYYAIYLRDGYRQSQAPSKRISCFVGPVIIEW